MGIPNLSVIFKNWVDLYSDKMYSWAFYKLGNKEEAEDIVQDTFLAALDSMEKFEGRSEPKTWLFSILNNKIAEYFRKVYRSPVANENSINDNCLNTFFDNDGGWINNQIPAEWNNDKANLLDDTDFTKVLKNCMGNLPLQWNAAIQLKYIEEKKADTICQELQIATTNYWQILHRAKLQLRKCLEIHWFKK